MSRYSLDALLKEGFLCCPSCRASLKNMSQEGTTSIPCPSCNALYPVIDGCPLLLPPSSARNETKEEIRAFWGDLYKKSYSDHDRTMGRQNFFLLLNNLEALFEHRRHLAACEMPLKNISGLRVLEIGSGAGAHSALFSYKGAHMVSMDLTLERVIATAQKLDLLENSNNICLQGDAERLPLADHSFDIVYSNGVLHHTPDTEKTIREVYRVLKPGGRAVIMLYAKNSWLYWVNLFLIKGLLLGRAFRHKNWLGRNTEWMSNRPQRMLNPETKVYSKKEILRLFASFRNVSVRKNSFVIHQIPLLGRFFSRLLGKMTGYNQAGVLLYGHPWRNETRWEIWLGKYMGFAWNILATKS